MRPLPPHFKHLTLIVCEVNDIKHLPRIVSHIITSPSLEALAKRLQDPFKCKGSQANANVMPMITRAGVNATDALKTSSEVNLMLEMKKKSQKKSHLHRWASITWISVDHVHSK